MIYTVTLNPALDFELKVSHFEFDSVIRAEDSRMDCGGKGFNVSRMLKNLGTPSVTMGFLGGKTGERLEQELQQAGIDTDFTYIAGETRTNVSIVAKKHIKVNEQGPEVSSEELSSLLDTVKKNVRAGDWWVLGGSLPKGVDASIYAQLITIIREAGAYSLLDSSGEALRLGCAAKPTLIKPNFEEAMELIGESVHANVPVKDWTRRILALGPESLIVSMGKDGALLANGETIETIQSPRIIEKNPIGAGDSLVGGLVHSLSQGKALPEALRYGAACGAATASQSGTELGTKAMVEALL